jgi:lysophospholipid acyltransferase (LPLAT)-like uncharacterized protein
MEALRERLLRVAVPPLGHAYIRLLRRTMRIEYRDREHIERIRAREGRYILAFWHARFLLMPYAYPGGRIVVLTSRHRDGRMIAAVLERFGLETAAGSSSAGGVLGMREVLRRVRDGYDVGFTPDGPRGPRRRAKAGVVLTARLTGLPIVPVAFSARPARRLRSWDRTLVPRPFARGIFVYGEPLAVQRDAGEADSERMRRLVEAAIDRVTDAADRAVGLEPEEPPPAGAP